MPETPDQLTQWALASMLVLFIVILAAVLIILLVGVGIEIIDEQSKLRKKKRRPKLVAVNLETDKTRDVEPLERLTCTYCGGHDFYEGPSGGMMTNIMCANPKCRHWFNACPSLGIFDDLRKQGPE